MKMIRSIMPVGQGAFYCEKFILGNENINIVYDCGTNSEIKKLKKVIDRNFYEGEIIHALFISHLHNDHVNGIEYLIKRCKVKNIFFPLMTENDKIIIKIYNEVVFGRDNFANILIEDPFNYFRENSQNIQIYGVRANNGDYSRIGGVEPIQGGDISWLIRTENDNSNEEFNDWKFIVYNIEQEQRKEKLIELLKEKLNREIDAKELENIWLNSNKQEKDKVKEAYKKIEGGLNTNSMTLFSGIEDDSYIQEIIKYNGAEHLYERRCCGRYYREVCCRDYYRLNGCLYTGDYNMKLNYKTLKEKYQDYKHYIGSIQIPHHGSRHNFIDDILYDYNAINFMSVGNNFDFPNPQVIRKIINSGNYPYIVTEDDFTELEFLIHKRYM